jgi:hypothetical protein
MRDANTPTELHLNRREWLQGVLALAAPIGLNARQPLGTQHTLRNANIDFHFEVAQGRITSRRLVNKLAKEIVELPDADFALEFEDHASVAPSDLWLQ